MQIFLIVLYQLIGFAFWVYIQPVLPESYGLFLLSTHIWIGFNSINPIIYLIFNRQFSNFINKNQLPSPLGSICGVLQRRIKKESDMLLRKLSKKLINNFSVALWEWIITVCQSMFFEFSRVITQIEAWMQDQWSMREKLNIRTKKCFMLETQKCVWIW